MFAACSAQKLVEIYNRHCSIIFIIQGFNNVFQVKWTYGPPRPVGARARTTFWTTAVPAAFSMAATADRLTLRGVDSVDWNNIVITVRNYLSNIASNQYHN